MGKSLGFKKFLTDSLLSIITIIFMAYYSISSGMEFKIILLILNLLNFFIIFKYIFIDYELYENIEVILTTKIDLLDIVKMKVKPLFLQIGFQSIIITTIIICIKKHLEVQGELGNIMVWIVTVIFFYIFSLSMGLITLIYMNKGKFIITICEVIILLGGLLGLVIGEVYFCMFLLILGCVFVLVGIRALKYDKEKLINRSIKL